MTLNNNFSRVDKFVEQFERKIKNPKNKGFKELYTGIDLGTACITVSVLDEKRKPVAGFLKWDNVVRDGMVVDYIGAVDSLKEIKENLEKRIGAELVYASCAIPPGTEKLDNGVIKNVIESSGFINADTFDEPTAANALLQIQNGAIVDIGGGTTGISVIKDSEVVYISDEATGGSHFSLVIAGALKKNYDEAELMKRDYKNHDKLRPIVKPVIDKISTIIGDHIAGKNVDEIYLVGGSCCFSGIEKMIEENLGIKTVKPYNPLFITPLGIALGSSISTKIEG